MVHEGNLNESKKNKQTIIKHFSWLKMRPVQFPCKQTKALLHQVLLYKKKIS